MVLDYTKTFASGGSRATISDEEWAGGWVVVVGGINGIPTAQQFNAVSYIIESKVNEAHRIASEALKELGTISTGATKTEASTTNGNILVDGKEMEVYRHPAGQGYGHVPAGGKVGQALVRTDEGYGWGDSSAADAEKPIKDASAETVVVDDDTIPFTDVSDASKTKKITWLNIKTLLNTWARDLFAPENHTHDDRYYTETEMDDKLKAIAFSGSYTDLKDVPDSFTPSAHNQDASTITTGTIAVPRGGTGAGSFPVGNILVGAGTDAITSIPPSSLTSKVGLVYGICSTAASTAAKVVNAPDFILAAGAHVTVTFNNAVPANATLNINGTGAKAIYWQGENVLDGAIIAKDTCELVYTGNYYYLMVIDRLAATGGINSVSFAADSWDTISKICKLGKHRSFYNIGDTKTVMLTTNEMITVRIEDFDHDNLVTGGKAPITVGMVDCLKDSKRMRADNVNAGGWKDTEMRNATLPDLISKLPADLRNIIKAVNKLSSSGSQSTALQTTQDTLWLFSYTEVAFPIDANYSPGGEGTAYPLFVADASRVKKVNGSADGWWLRSPYLGSSASFCYVYSNGTRSGYFASGSYGVAVGFCI